MKEKDIDNMLWWQREIIYQIYPRSFKDSDGDGIGDLNGIAEKLDYFTWLGIKAIWISPIYPSPMADFGYDVSDYTDIHKIFGNMDDFDKLLKEAHKRNIKVILDLVPNHTSDQHPWFQESRSSLDNPKRDWYLWMDPDANGNPPNNWISEFGGSAWEYDADTGQYFSHTFLKEQPDLNWYHPEVQDAVRDVMRFWFDKGVDGFRIDVLWYLIKDRFFRDNPPNPDWDEQMADHDRLIPAFSGNQPDNQYIVSKLRETANEYEDRVLIGELYLPISELIAYYGKGKGVHLPFNFHLLLSEWNAERIYALIAEYEGAVPSDGWPNWVLGNHDKPRLGSRIGEKQLKNAAILLLTLRGTPTIYYGEEIGMMDVNIPKDRLQDPRAVLEPDKGVGRDPERTPMQWNDGKYAGFSLAEPWLPIGKNYKKINVEAQKKDENSLLSLYRKLIKLRQKSDALLKGTYLPAGIKENVFCYIRQHEEEAFLIALNIGNNEGNIEPNFTFKGKIEICTDIDKEGQFVNDKLTLEPNEGIVIKIQEYPLHK